MNSIKKNFLYHSLYQILAMLIPLITTPYISRVLGADGVGVYSYTYSIANYFGIFILLGLNNYGNRSIAQVRDDSSRLSSAFWEIYAQQLVLGVIISAVYILYSVLFASDPLIALIMGIYVVSNVFDINWLFFGLEKFRLTVMRNTIVKIVTTVCIFVFVRDENDVWKYCLIMTGGMLVSQVVLWPYVMVHIRRVRPRFSDIRKHIRPNLLLFLTVLATSLFKIMDKIMLGLMTFTAQVGYYESSERIIQIPTALIISLGTVMLPRMSNMAVSQKKDQSTELIGKSIVFAMFLSTSLCFGIMGISKTFVPLFYGEGYQPCILLFEILMPSCVSLAFANVIRTQYLLPQKMDKVYVISAFLGAAVNISINLLLIPKMQAAGAAIGTLAAEAVVCFYQSFMVRAYLPLKKYIIRSIPYIISGGVMCLILWQIDFTAVPELVNLLLQILCGIGIYFGMLLIQFVLYRKVTGKPLRKLL